MKECPVCKQVKETSEFHKNKVRRDGLRWECKKCTAKFNKERYAKTNREDFNRKALEYYRKHPQKAKENSRKWQSNNLERAKRNNARWRANNPEKLRIHAKRAAAKRIITPKWRLNQSVRSGIQSGIRKGSKNWRHWEDLVGYTLNKLMGHLEKQFVSGMSWDNYGQWHIDHIIPISAFNFTTPDDIDFGRCWALKNLRPLWKTENLKKKDKIERPFQPSLCL